MREVRIAITAASYSGNKGAAAMLQSSIRQLHKRYGEQLTIHLMSVYPSEDRKQVPWDFVKIISTKPEQLLFLAFPLAILYWLFRWCPPVRWLLKKNKIIRTYLNTDLVLDEAGISFVDSRGFVMNTYAFVCAAVPLLLGVPVVKYSQALGTFKNSYNRFLAKWILPKLSLICARGHVTYDNLAGIGVTENVRLCADGAFTMEDDPAWIRKIDELAASDSFFTDQVVGLSISSVVQKKCTALGIDYPDIMASFVDELNRRGYPVLLIANAARIHSEKTRNNDLMTGDDIHSRVKNPALCRWYHEEMDAEQIRALIGKCRYLVASRFHAMIGALEQKVPVLLIGWSHKYQEVLDMFGLGQYAIDFSKLTLEDLLKEFDQFTGAEQEIRSKLEANLAKVQESSYRNIRYTTEILDQILASEKSGARGVLQLNDPDKYLGKHVKCRMGYAGDESIRHNAASGGMVTALLCHLLRSGQIDGAWVTKSKVEDGKLGYETFIATTEEEIRSASSSIYMDMPLLKHLDLVRKFDGKIAVVLTPCLTRALAAAMAREPKLAEKIVLKLTLYCSGNHSEQATLLSLDKSGVSLANAVRVFYRRGHWRGSSAVVYKDGQEKSFSYTKTICAYKNAYFFERRPCMTCQDHFGGASDISFGDIWLKSMKKNPIKHTSCVIRNEKALQMYQSAVDAGAIVDFRISDTDMVRSQKRALVFKYCCAQAKQEYLAKQGTKVTLDTTDRCRWNHRLAYFLARKNEAFSREKPEKLAKIPMWVIYNYMCFIRVLLSF